MKWVKSLVAVVVLLVGVALIAGGTALLTKDRDRDDFFVSDGHRFDRSSYAIVSETVDVFSGSPTWLAGVLTDPVDTRARVASFTGGDVFVGIGPHDDVTSYLSGVAHDRIESIALEGARIDYSPAAGTNAPSRPGDQTFWVASIEGPGTQTLDWSTEQGTWDLVVMNADASPGIDVGAVVGVRLSNVVAVAWAVIAVGLVLMLAAARTLQRVFGASLEETPKRVSRRAVDLRFAARNADEGPGWRFFGWLDRRHRPVTAGVFVLALAMAGVSTAWGSTAEPSADPSGELYTVAERAAEAFAGATAGNQAAAFLVESPDDGDVLTRDALLEFTTNVATLRNEQRDVEDRPLASRLASGFDTTLGVPVDGVFSIAQVVEAQLDDGLATATDADVKLALEAILADDAPTAALRGTLSRFATATPQTVAGRTVTVWSSPAFQATVLYDFDSFPADPSLTDPDAIDFDRFVASERWLREVQSELRGDEVAMRVQGVGIDVNLAFEEQAAEAMPFILLAVVVIVLVVGALLRSYWSAVYVTVGLAASTLVYKGIFALIGFKGGMLLGFIVPISIISFGVDFFIHAMGRAREAIAHGCDRSRAYPLGMSAVAVALVLAAGSSALAFVSNAVSGIEMVTQFGVGAAIALLVAFGILGVLTPKLVLATEDSVGPAPLPKGPRVLARTGFALTALVAGTIVALGVGAPLAGAVGMAVFAGLFIWLPMLIARRRNRRIAAAGAATAFPAAGAGHGLRSAGSVVHFMARWRVVTIPAVAILAALGLWGASQVRSDFAFTDFLAEDSDTVRGLDRLEHHFGDLGVGTGYIYVEGDLTRPETLRAMNDALTSVVESGVALPRDFNGDIETIDNALTLTRFALASGTARNQIAAATGESLTDGDGDGFPDTAAQIAAVYRVASTEGLVDDGGNLVYPPDVVRRILWIDGANQATRLEVVIGSFTDGPLIEATRAALDDAAATLTDQTAGAGITSIGVSGESLQLRNTLDAFTRSMLLSLPLAFVLTLILAALILRSWVYAFASVTPILLVVAWVYGFMHLAGYTINPVTATIAAIAIGVGIDFATHFTVRFREELAGEPSRFPALRRAGEGTGGALTLSALTSIAGFAILAFAPMPVFAVYGVLTAVMIALAVLVSLLVLPSLLLLVTPSIQGPERERLVEMRTSGDWSYEPHRRDTATQSI